MRTIGTKKQKISAAVWSGIERLERRQMLSVSAETLVGTKGGPKAAGDTWTYSMTTTFSTSIETIVETVIGNTTFMGNSVTEVDDSVTSNTNSDTHLDKEYFAFDSSGNWVEYGSVETTTNSDGDVIAATTNTESPPELIIPAELTAGQQTAPATSTQTSVPGTVTISITQQYELKSETKEPVTVPAGTFSAYDLTSNESALQEGNSTPATVASDLFFDPAVGLVKLVAVTAEGTTTQVLESYSLSGGGGGGGGGGGATTGVTPTITKDTVPAAVVGGATLHGASLTVSLDNTGTTAEKGFTANVYASTDTTLDTTADTLINSIPKPTTTVNAEKVTTLSIPITKLPSSLDGTYYLIVQTVDSASNTLSAVSSSTTFVSAPFVSLAESVTTTLPSELVSGTVAKGTVTVDITNNGNVPSKGVTPIDVTLSETPGLLGTTIVTSSKSYTINPGKSTKVVEQIKSTPALADGSYFVVAQTTDPFAGRTSVASSSSAITVAAPFITLVSALGPATKSGDTLTITDDGNIPDNITKIATSLQVSTDPGGLDPVGAAVSATVGSPHILAGKSVKIHLSQWKSIIASLSPGTYYLTADFDDGAGNSGFAVSSTSFTA